MNSLKTAVILAVLLGAAYWVYDRINPSATTSPPPGVDSWATGVDVQIPSAGDGQQPGAGEFGATPPAWGDTASYQATPATPGGAAATSLDAAPIYAQTEIPAYATASPTEPAAGDTLPPPFPPEGFPSASATPATGAVTPSADGSNLAAAPYPYGTTPSGMTALAAATVPAGAVTAASSGPNPFDRLMETVEEQLAAGSLAEGLETLSRFYGDPRFSDEQNQRLTAALDQVAGTVIYSRQHSIEPARVVRPGETLDQIAAEYKVPVGLLAKINGISDPQNLTPGQELKVVRGPFSAVVDLQKHELTLMLQNRYAGRFPIGVGRDCPSMEGTYEVRDKTMNPTYYGREQVIDAGDPRNPLGSRWIGLAQASGGAATAPVGIHGTDNPSAIGGTPERGTISLGPRDAEDVYDILSVGSRVVIRR